MRDLLIAGHGASVSIRDEAGGIVTELLRALFPQNLVTDAAPRRAAPSFRVKPDAKAEGLFRVTQGRRAVVKPASAERAATELRCLVEPMLAASARDTLFVHAGAVAWQGHGIVIPGRSQTGKSRLVAELVRLGATYYSDEFAIFDDDGMLHPYPRPIRLRDGEGNESWQHVDGPIGHAPVPVTFVVSTQHRPDAVWQPAQETGLKAALPIIDNTFLACEEPGRAMHLAGTLARRVVALSGPRPDVSIAAPAILRAVEEYAGSKPAVRAARYVRVENVLAPDELQSLHEFVSTRQAEFKESGVDNGTEARVDVSYRKSRTIHDLEAVWPMAERRLQALLPAVRQELGMGWFPQGEVERQMTLHGRGGFFKIHTDNGSPSTSLRRLTAVYYFFREPRRFTGGELGVYHPTLRNGHVEPGALHERLTPINNSIVFFRSDTWHEVLPVHCETDDIADSRCAINIWIREGEMPALIGPDAAQSNV